MHLPKFKNLNFSLYFASDTDIFKIKGVNISLTNLSITWKNNKENCTLIGLQKKFPNLSNIKIITPKRKEDLFNFEFIKPIININENKNCKINKMDLLIGIPNNLIQLDCAPFEKLIEVKLILQPYIYNIGKIFPLLNDNCQTIFKSLKVFYFQ